MKTLTRPFTEHPAEVGESYGEHLKAASGFGLSLVFAGLACLLHGLFPFMFSRTGSRKIIEFHDKMVTNRTSRVVLVPKGKHAQSHERFTHTHYAEL